MVKKDIRLVIAAPSLAGYLKGGGHWSWILQYLLGLRDLGVQVFLLSPLKGDKNDEATRARLHGYFRLLSKYGFADQAYVVLHQDSKSFESASFDAISHGGPRLAEVISTSDAVWDFAKCLPRSFIEQFKRRALIDVDPGHLQISLLAWDESVEHYDVFFSVGLNVGLPGCEVPTMGKSWHSYLQVVHLPSWPAHFTPPPSGAAITSVTHWNWGELHFNSSVLSLSKRDAYLKYVSAPARLGFPLELATSLGEGDSSAADRALLEKHRWRLADPYKVAGSVGDYQRYIQNSIAELCCPKPIYRDLQTGWQSDRSVAYLASGRPVLMEDTGLSHHVNTDKGLLFFSDIESLSEAAEQIRRDYAAHSRAAREIAEAYFSTSRILPRLLELTTS
jgi:hypothetical protein